jgi:hypothetical protein
MSLEQTSSPIQYDRTPADAHAELASTGVDEFAAELAGEDNLAGLARHEPVLQPERFTGRHEPYHGHTEGDDEATRQSEAAWKRLQP